MSKKLSHEIEMLFILMCLTIYLGLSKRESRFRTLSKLKRLVKTRLEALGFDQTEVRYIEREVIKMYKTVYKASFLAISRAQRTDISINYYTNVEKRSEIVFSSLNNYITTPKTIRKALNEIKLRKQGREKAAGLEKMLNQVSDYSPFFICSYHPDPRPEHGRLQGKIYYDEKWKNHISDPKLARQVADFIDEGGLMSVQKVTKAPYWLVTGANCRHFLRKVDLEDAFQMKNKDILAHYGMIMKPERKISPEAYQQQEKLRRLNLYKVLYNSIKNDKIKGLLR